MSRPTFVGSARSKLYIRKDGRTVALDTLIRANQLDPGYVGNVPTGNETNRVANSPNWHSQRNKDSTIKQREKPAQSIS
jgi:hypothetical protein